MLRRSFMLGACMAALVPAARLSAQTVADRLRTLVAEHLRVDAKRVTAKATFKQLGADDLDVTELVMATEEAFSIEIPDESAKKLKSFGDLVKFVEVARKAQPALKMAPTSGTK